MSVSSVKKKRPGWRDVLRGLSQPKVGIMLMLGFSSGLPFMLVGNTMARSVVRNWPTLLAYDENTLESADHR